VIRRLHTSVNNAVEEVSCARRQRRRAPTSRVTFDQYNGVRYAVRMLCVDSSRRPNSRGERGAFALFTCLRRREEHNDETMVMVVSRDRVLEQRRMEAMRTRNVTPVGERWLMVAAGRVHGTRHLVAALLRPASTHRQRLRMLAVICGAGESPTARRQQRYVQHSDEHLLTSSRSTVARS